MATCVDGRYVFPLTSLQIGDLQSYLSHLNLFLADESGNFYILVDNRPWLKDLVSRSAHWWQLMVTKSRLSPFANTRGKKEKRMSGELSDLQASSSSDEGKLRKFRDWFTLIDAVLLSRDSTLLPVKKLKNSLLGNSELHRTLYGFIVFEVAWNNVRGINYWNELQTDTSLAIEAKIMRRWEFDSISQAARNISLWFPGTMCEQILLKEHLDSSLDQLAFTSFRGIGGVPTFCSVPLEGQNINGREVYHDAQESFQKTIGATINEMPSDIESSCSPNHNSSVYPEITRFPDGPYKRRKVIRPINYRYELDICSGEANTESFEVLPQTSDVSDCEEVLEATIYRDVLILFRFNDPHLPFKLRDIVVSKLQLLTLLEAGLPAWVIFLQSYPGFCRLYRPWMCPLARALYVLISIVTVLIGFYDLYKNVPPLKATVSKTLGPLFDWIEAWEMTSRIKYLGTMLFLHNFQKAMRWFLTVTRTFFSLVAFFLAPIARELAELLECFFPVWSLFKDLSEDIVSAIWAVMESFFTIAGDVSEILLLPLWYILVITKNVAATFLYPVFWVFVYAPFRLLFGFFRSVATSCTFTHNLVRDIWRSARSIFQVTRSVESNVSTIEISMWRSLWNDLFSQVFRALRSILNGFVAFFIACNRHRLSIYNHTREFTKRSLRSTRGMWRNKKA